MPRRARRSRKPRSGRKGLRRANRRSMPTTADKGHTARIIETLETTDIDSNQPYSQVFKLGQFPRASALAACFMFYRAKRVIYNYEPLYNTFQDGNGAASKPYMYVVMNRSQQLLTNTMTSLSSFQVAGSRPVGLTGTKVVSYRPNWCSPGLLAVRTTTAGGGQVLTDYATLGQQVQYGWLATPEGILNFYSNVTANDQPVNNLAIPTPITGQQPFSTQPSITNSAIYNGHLVFLDQKILGDSVDAPVCRVTIQVEWEFKGAKNPFVTKQPTPPGEEVVA